MDSPASIFGSSVTGVYEMEMSLAYASPFYGRTKSGPPQRRDDQHEIRMDTSPLFHANPSALGPHHPRTWHRAARLGQVSFHRLQRGLRGWS